jgi:sodium/bile acid cotransporter 7
MEPMFDPRVADDEAKRARIDRLYRRYRWLLHGVPELTVAELEVLQRQRKVLLVDVREPRERRVSTLPGAISREELEARRVEAGDAVLVAYCTIGLRSGRYARRLRARGYEAYNLRGSILAWTHAGGELASEGRPTRRVHVVARRWALQAQGYEPVW